MANAIGTISAPPVAGPALALNVNNFLTTGSLAPTTASPAFRAGSTTTFTGTSVPTSVSISLSPNIVTGDCIILAVQQSGSNPTTNPPGFLFMGSSASSAYTHCFWRIAQATDPGSSITWTHGFGAVNMAVAVAAYSGVNTIVPGYLSWSTTAGSTVLNAATMTTTVASTVVEIFGAQAASTTIAGPTTQRVTANISNAAIVISDQTQGAAGTTGTQTCSTSVSGPIQSMTIVLHGAVSGGTPPLGGWTVVDQYTPAPQGYQYVVWQSPSASNNAGGTWYLIMYYALGGYNVTATTFGFYPCEVYNTTNHTYNATTIASSSSAAPFVPSAGTTPPYAQVSGAPNTPVTAYTNMYQANGTVSSGTSNFLIAANKDGFFLSLLGAGTLVYAVFVGTGTTLVSNANLSDPVPLFMAKFDANTASVTREPGWTSAGTYWGTYTLYPFMPQTTGIAFATCMGTVNSTGGDAYLAPTGQPIACRWFIARTTNSNLGINVGGSSRAILPSWLQWAQQSGCNWGDTATEIGDQLTFAGTSGAATTLWVDTSAA